MAPLLFYMKMREKGSFVIQSNQARASAERSLKITTALEQHPQINGGTQEVEIIKDIIKDTLLAKSHYHITESEINDYFRPFSMRALAESGIV
jgi:hypothetical protein